MKEMLTLFLSVLVQTAISLKSVLIYLLTLPHALKLQYFH